MLRIKNIPVWCSDLLNSVNAFRQILNGNFAVFICHIFTDGIIFRFCNFELSICQRFLCFGIYFDNLQSRFSGIGEYKCLCLSPFQSNVLMTVRINGIAVRCFYFFHCINSFIKVMDNNRSCFVRYILTDGFVF